MDRQVIGYAEPQNTVELDDSQECRSEGGSRPWLGWTKLGARLIELRQNVCPEDAERTSTCCLQKTQPKHSPQEALAASG